MIDSNLLFNLLKLNFSEILKKSGKLNAIQYARNNFKDFSERNMQEIQQLMTSILFSEKIEDCPYNQYFNENYWKIMEGLLVEETCRLLKVLPDSIL